MDDFVSVNKLAEILGLSRRRVNQLAADGIVVKGKRGQYNLAASVQGYCQSIRDGLMAEDEEGKNLVDHKLRYTAAKADTEEMRAAKMRGDLIPAKDVQVAWQEMSHMTRQRVLSVAPDATVQVRAAKTDAEGKELLQKSLTQALRSIASADISVKPRDPDGSQMADDDQDTD